ncbi:hypothetical protein Bca52824_088113 [Brassica carinata]|nr:hypothetical protein Bca52824_088113 [Brassica carinata]
MNLNPNPQGLYCLRFAPTDVEVIDQFLVPRHQHLLNLNRSLIRPFNFFRTAPQQLNLEATYGSEYYPRRGLYWFLVERPASVFAVPGSRTLINRMGSWKRSGKPENIVSGGIMLGTKQLFKFLYTDPTTSKPANLKTGYSLYEYAIPDPPLPQTPADDILPVEPTVVVNVFYNVSDDEYRRSGHAVPQEPVQVVEAEDNGEAAQGQGQEYHVNNGVNPQEPYCVRFAPTDVEVMEQFLVPRHQLLLNLYRSVILPRDFYRTGPHYLNLDGMEHNEFYPRRGFYWFLVARPASVFAVPGFRTLTNGMGSWKRSGKPQDILSGGIMLGTKQLFKFFYTNPTTSKLNKLKTGWSLYEYAIPDPPLPQAPTDDILPVEPTVVVNVFYNFSDDEYLRSGLAVPNEPVQVVEAEDNGGEDNGGDVQGQEGHVEEDNDNNNVVNDDEDVFANLAPIANIPNNI